MWRKLWNLITGQPTENDQHLMPPAPMYNPQTDEPAAPVVHLTAAQKADVVQMVHNQKKLEAIKKYKELTGVGLAEAKEAVEQLEREFAHTPPTYEHPDDWHRELESTADGQTMADVYRFMQLGRKIEAIKVYRELTGKGLAESKEAVEQMERDGFPALSNTPPAGNNALDVAQLEEEVRELLGRNNKIEAIKIVRERTALGLKEAKDAVDAFQARPELGLQLPAEKWMTSPAANPESGLTPAVLQSIETDLRNNRLINAIKTYREATGLGLKESKDAVEEMQRRLR
jgi:ribosomal protein L7/L12